MLSKKMIILAIFLVSLLAIGAVSAEDSNTSDIVGADSSININIIGDESNSDSDSSNSILTVTNSDENLKASENNSELLADSPKTFSQLNDLIQSSTGSVINLEFDYAYSSADNLRSGILINKSITINGNGHTIDGKNQVGIFWVNASNVVLNDITFINSQSNYGSAVLWDDVDNGSIVGCSFVDNSATIQGGAVYWLGSGGSIVGSSFVDNSASEDAGAVLWAGSGGSVDNCSFENNHAGIFGGAVL